MEESPETGVTSNPTPDAVRFYEAEFARLGGEIADCNKEWRQLELSVIIAIAGFYAWLTVFKAPPLLLMIVIPNLIGFLAGARTIAICVHFERLADYLWILENHLLHRPGHNCWPSEVRPNRKRGQTDVTAADSAHSRRPPPGWQHYFDRRGQNLSITMGIFWGVYIATVNFLWIWVYFYPEALTPAPKG